MVPRHTPDPSAGGQFLPDSDAKQSSWARSPRVLLATGSVVEAEVGSREASGLAADGEENGMRHGGGREGAAEGAWRRAAATPTGLKRGPSSTELC